MFIETSSANHGSDNVFVSLERTDIIQNTNITFYYNRLCPRDTRTMGRFKIQLLLEDTTWSTRYNLPKNDRYSDTSTDWTVISLDLTEEKYDVKIICDECDSAHADLLFSNITKTHSVH